ncbi:MAG: hypothetical protein KDD61_04545 [Bdellovibrionales bacterium]|nr:hypothetical protein [Bdellovibrionales bacterium]
MKMVYWILWLCCFSFAEARTVNVMIADKQIALTNPSTVPVTFNVSCYDSAGSQLVNLSGETLAPNASKVYGGSVDISTVSNNDACSASAVMGYFSHVSCGSTLQAKICPGSVTYANASTLCGPGLTICKYLPGNFMSCSGLAGYWMAPPESGTFAASADGGCTYNSLTGAQGIVVSDYYSCSSAVYGQKCQVNGTDTVNYGCGLDNVTASYGTVCCALPSSSFCKVTITTTDVNAHLSSPGFKGGAPF